MYMNEGNILELLIGTDNYYDLVCHGTIKRVKLITLFAKCGYALSWSSTDRSNTVLEVAANPTSEYTDRREHQSRRANVNKSWEQDHIGIISRH